MTAARRNTPKLTIVEAPSEHAEAGKGQPGSVVSQLPLSRLVVSLWNARKTLDTASLAQLADSVRQHGVLVNLIVRKLDGGGRFEIVAGHRRYEAAKLAGLVSVPCEIRDLPDDDAREIGLIDNLQREDLPPMEEAEAYGLLLDRPGATAETVAAAIGKSASYVGRRLQLLKSIGAVRDALRAGAIEVGHSLELARLEEKQQIRHLSWLSCGFVYTTAEEDKEAEGHAFSDEDEDSETDPPIDGASQWRPTFCSVAQLRKRIAETTLHVLSDAPFPLADEIAPIACTECPKRSGNATLLFDDCGQDTCTDRECFDQKAKLWIQIEIENARAQKRPLLKVADGYTSEKGVLRDYEVRILTTDAECPNGEDAIWIDGAKAGHRLRICREPKCKTHKDGRFQSSSPAHPKDAAKVKADRKDLLAKVDREKQYRTALLKAIAAATIPVAAAPDLNLELVTWSIGRANSQHAGKLAEAFGWPEQLFGWRGREGIAAKLKAMNPGERLRVALLAVHSGELAVSEFNVDNKPEDLESLAKGIGVDLKKVRAGVSGKAAAKSASGKNAGKTKAALSPSARKRIAAAQKKRWTGLRKKAGRK